jgi:hypothetical protein
VVEDLVRELAKEIRERGEEVAARLPPSVAEELRGGFADAAARLFAWLGSLQRAGVVKPLPRELALLASLYGALTAKILCDAAADLVEKGVEPAEAFDEALDLAFSWRTKLVATAALLGSAEAAEGGEDG